MRHQESFEQRTVAFWLRKAGIFFCAIPNGGFRNRFEAGRMKAEGVTAGAPDILIFDAPPCDPTYFVGVALEMKREKGGVVSDAQRAFMKELDHRGWLSIVANGANDAFEKLTNFGYRGLPVPNEVQP
jgi:hypothetical protein